MGVQLQGQAVAREGPARPRQVGAAHHRHPGGSEGERGPQAAPGPIPPVAERISRNA